MVEEISCPYCPFVPAPGTNPFFSLQSHVRNKHKDEEGAKEFMESLKAPAKQVKHEEGTTVPSEIEFLASFMRKLGIKDAPISAATSLFEDEDPNDLNTLKSILQQVGVPVVSMKAILRKWSNRQQIQPDKKMAEFIGTKYDEGKRESDYEDNVYDDDLDDVFKEVEKEEKMIEKMMMKMRRRLMIAKRMKAAGIDPTEYGYPDPDKVKKEEKIIEEKDDEGYVAEFPPDSGQKMKFKSAESYADKVAMYEKMQSQKKIPVERQDEGLVTWVDPKTGATEKVTPTMFLRLNNMNTPNTQDSEVMRRLDDLSKENTALKDKLDKKENDALKGQIGYLGEQVEKLINKNPLEELKKGKNALEDVVTSFGYSAPGANNIETMAMTAKVDTLAKEVGILGNVVSNVQNNHNVILKALQPVITESAMNFVKKTRAEASNSVAEGERVPMTDDDINARYKALAMADDDEASQKGE